MPEHNKPRLTEASRRYRDLVMNVLEQLRQTEYPNYTLWEDGPAWAIGYQAENDYGTPFFWREVSVYLRLDQNNNPVGFVCRRHGNDVRKKRSWLQRLLGQAEWGEKYIETDLSETALSQALAQLRASRGADTPAMPEP